MPEPTSPGLIFDLDGTLVDSVYQRVLAWREAFDRAGLEVSSWRIHRKIGIDGGILSRLVLRELGRDIDQALADELESTQDEIFGQLGKLIRPAPGARRLLARLTELGVSWAIATSSSADAARPSLEQLDVPDGIPVVAGNQAGRAKPDPDLLLAAARELDRSPQQTIVVGDSVWDILAARRAGAPAVGLLMGGYARAELAEVGAYRVYADPADLHDHLEEVGVRLDQSDG